MDQNITGGNSNNGLDYIVSYVQQQATSPPPQLPEPYYPQSPNSNINGVNDMINHNLNLNNNSPLSQIIINPTSTSNNPLQQVIYSEFQMSPNRASSLFTSWIGGLWFKPTGFTKLVDTTRLEKVYIPFYSFSINYNVDFQGFITHDSKLHLQHIQNKERENSSANHSGGSGKKSSSKDVLDTSTNDNINASSNLNSNSHSGQEIKNNLNTNNELINYNDKDIKWKKVDGSISRRVNKILLLACNSMDLISDESILNCLNVHFDFNDTIETTLVQFKEEAKLVQQAEVLTKYEPELIWNKDYFQYLQDKEQSMSVEYLKQQEQTMFVKKVSSDITFKEKTYTLVYIPFYYSKYEYQNKSYSFFVNAQNGQVSSVRPEIGLGKLGDAIKYTRNYFSTIFGYSESFRKLKGDDLACYDEIFQVYDIHNYFLCFTRSDTYLFSGSANGYFVVRNNSSHSATLRGQKRRSAFKGNPFTLPSQTERIFSYRGHWCVEILQGEVQSIDIIKVNPRDGGNNFQSIKN